MASTRHRCPKPGCTGRNCAKGNWHWQVRVSGALPVHGFAPTKTDADRDASDTETRIRRELREGTYSATPRVEQTKTLGDLVDAYVKKVLPDKDRNKSADTTKQQLGWWRERGGRRLLSQVTPEWISEMKVVLRKRDLSKASVNRYLAALSSAYTGVIRELHWKVTNPVKLVTKYSEALTSKKIFSAAVAGERGRYVDPDTELPQLLEAAQAHDILPWVVMLISSGARKGELEDLRWAYVHLEERERTWIEIIDPKNGESRAIDIADGNILKPVSMLREMKRVRSLTFDSRKYDHVFGPFPRKRWEKALEAARIENLVVHDLRHTAASYMTMAGVEVRDLMNMMGWRSPMMPLRYVHLSPKHTAKVAQQYMSNY